MVHLDPNSVSNSNVTCHRNEQRLRLIVPLPFYPYFMLFLSLNTEGNHTSPGVIIQLRVDTRARTPARAHPRAHGDKANSDQEKNVLGLPK